MIQFWHKAIMWFTRAVYTVCLMFTHVFCDRLTLWMPSSLTHTLRKSLLKALLSVKAKKRMVLSCRRWAISSRIRHASSVTHSLLSPDSDETYTHTNTIDRMFRNSSKPKCVRVWRQDSLRHLFDDILQVVRLQNDGFQHAGFTGHQSLIQCGRVTSQRVSQITGGPPFLQDVFKIISLLQHWMPWLDENTLTFIIFLSMFCSGMWW